MKTLHKHDLNAISGAGIRAFWMQICESKGKADEMMINALLQKTPWLKVSLAPKKVPYEK